MAVDRPRARVIREAAPAKINLFLHVVGRRADGYHRIDSLVAFAAIGDTIEVRAARTLTLAIDGPFAEGLAANASNLAFAAAERLRAATGAPGAALRLTKRLPIASGIGGGSADAAATLRALRRLWRLPPGYDLRPIAESLGADVPMCLARVPARVGGIGEELRPVRQFPTMPVVLANPRISLATVEVFRARTGAFGACAPTPPVWPDARGLARWLKRQRNDLYAPAARLAPGIDGVLDELKRAPGARLVRMSGSGATCFALFDTPDAARDAAARLRRRQPAWWIVASRLRASPEGPAYL